MTDLTPDDNDTHSYDDRDSEMVSDDEPRGTPPIVERPENTHIGWDGDDPAIDEAEPVATFERGA